MGSDLTIGFLGAGKMATALASGIVRAGRVAADHVWASDPVAGAREHFVGQIPGANASPDNQDVVDNARIIFLAVKPDMAAGVLDGIRDRVTADHLLISIMAGVSLEQLGAGFDESTRLIRAMPNTPALVGAAAVGFALGGGARPEDAEQAKALFDAVGLSFQVKESMLDAVTGLSGSGPAYVFLMLEALSDGGVASGLPRDVATKLAAQTLMGSARLLLETGQHPGALKDMVTSPGGTTAEGLHQLEQAGVRGALINAVRAATSKSKRLGRNAKRRNRSGS